MSLEDLPVSTKIEANPVLQRWRRREFFGPSLPPGAPDEKEMSAAIKILADPTYADDQPEMWLEAHRILDEAGA